MAVVDEGRELSPGRSAGMTVSEAELDLPGVLLNERGLTVREHSEERPGNSRESELDHGLGSDPLRLGKGGHD